MDRSTVYIRTERIVLCRLTVYSLHKYNVPGRRPGGQFWRCRWRGSPSWSWWRRPGRGAAGCGPAPCFRCTLARCTLATLARCTALVWIIMLFIICRPGFVCHYTQVSHSWLTIQNSLHLHPSYHLWKQKIIKCIDWYCDNVPNLIHCSRYKSFIVM